MGNCFGFGSEGVSGGSCASCYQSCCYGGDTPAGGWFALGQSRGAKGDGVSKVTVCFGLFLGILGILLIAGGVVVGYNPEKLDPILFYVEDVTQHEFLPTYQLMIAIGVFLCLSATCACCCGVFFNIAACCLLIAFIMVIVVVGCLSHSVSKFDSERLDSDIKTNMMAKINSTDFKSTDSILNYIQQKLECCGVQNPSDWQNNNNFNNETFPDSCCKVETPNCGQNYRPDDIFQDGCQTDMMHKITIYFRWQISFLAIFCLIATFVICFCCCIACGC
ncbi:CD63 antigen [Paramuricea clavata]|uniref:CD63 antigen n=1 Tax=Paramuricea clavata TaxID=317549 RepID=A0A6S7LR84_PARCT|nr:CD63 antigen [Paramuricea clavata]